MGTSLDNYYVWSESVTMVREALTALNRIAFVSDSCNGWVSVFPTHDYINQGEIAQQLSGHLNLPVISFWMYDSDVGGYRLYENGELRDEYETDPDYFASEMDQDGGEIPLKSPEERAKLSGDPAALLPYCLPDTTPTQVRDALGPPHAPTREPYQWGHIGPMTILPALCRLLDIAEDRLYGDYNSIDEGDAEFPVEPVGWEGASQEFKNESLASAIHRRDEAKARYWIAQGADINHYLLNGCTLLIEQAHHANPDTLSLFLKLGADVNLGTQPATHHPSWPETARPVGITPLMAAAGRSGGWPHGGAAVRLLLDAGADVHARDSDGQTALSRALSLTNPENHRHNMGRTASSEVLAKAASYSEEIVRLLRDAGAKD